MYLKKSALIIFGAVKHFLETNENRQEVIGILDRELDVFDNVETNNIWNGTRGVLFMLQDAEYAGISETDINEMTNLCALLKESYLS